MRRKAPTSTPISAAASNRSTSTGKLRWSAPRRRRAGRRCLSIRPPWIFAIFTTRGVTACCRRPYNGAQFHVESGSVDNGRRIVAPRVSETRHTVLRGYGPPRLSLHGARLHASLIRLIDRSCLNAGLSPAARSTAQGTRYWRLGQAAIAERHFADGGLRTLPADRRRKTRRLLRV